MPQWELVEKIDKQLAAMKFATIMLDFPEQLIETRCLQRPEENEDFADEQIKWYGSKTQTLDAFISSKNNRLQALTLSGMPFLIIDTSQKDWGKYIEEALTFIKQQDS